MLDFEIRFSVIPTLAELLIFSSLTFFPKFFPTFN